MRKEFSRAWKSSTKRSKQRKYRHNAPLHTKQKFVHVHLAKDLKLKHKKRSLALRKGDKVRIMIGNFKKQEGKVESINLTKSEVYVTGIEKTKRDGNKTKIALHPSNLMIVELSMEDKERSKIMERK